MYLTIDEHMTVSMPKWNTEISKEAFYGKNKEINTI